MIACGQNVACEVSGHKLHVLKFLERHSNCSLSVQKGKIFTGTKSMLSLLGVLANSPSNLNCKSTCIACLTRETNKAASHQTFAISCKGMSRMVLIMKLYIHLIQLCDLFCQFLENSAV